MKKDLQQMKDQPVFTEIDGNTLTPEQQANIIKSRRVLKQKHNEVRARYTEPVTDHDLLFESTPLFRALRILLARALVSTGQSARCIPTCRSNLLHEFYNGETDT